MYCFRKFCVSLQEGLEDELFEEEAVLPISCKEENNQNEDVDSAAFSAGNWNQDIKFVHNQVLMVDHDNKPAPRILQQNKSLLMNFLKIKVGGMMELITGQLLFLLIKSWHSKVDGGQVTNLLLRCSRRCCNMIITWELLSKALLIH